MKVLITGGAGMIGSHAAETWAGEGHDVTVLDNLMRSRLLGWARQTVESTWEWLGELPRVHRVVGDVRNAADVRRALGDGVDAILHAAAQPGVGYSIQHPEEDFAINAQGTLTVLEAARQVCPEATILYCSTNKVYGTNVERLPIREDARRYAFTNGLAGVPESLSVDLAGHTPYGVSKLAGELCVQDYAQTFGMRTGVFRMSCIYGTRQFGAEEQGWVAHFAICALLNRVITIYGDGKQVRDVLFVSDLIEAFAQFLSSSLQHGVYNMGGGPANTTSLLELLDELTRLAGHRPEVRFSSWRPNDQRVYISDLEKAKRELKWEPRVGLPEGLRRLVAWVSSHRNLFA